MNRNRKEIPGEELRNTDNPGARSTMQGNRLSSIRELSSLSCNGLWGLLAFLGISAIAFQAQHYSLTGSLPEGLRVLLGESPPVMLVDVLLLVSTLSELIIIAGRIHDETIPGNTWAHLGFRIMFYGLYFIADAMAEHLYVVFISGLTVLTLQHYHVWNYAENAIEQKRDELDAYSAMSKGGI